MIFCTFPTIHASCSPSGILSLSVTLFFLHLQAVSYLLFVFLFYSFFFYSKGELFHNDGITVDTRAVSQLKTPMIRLQNVLIFALGEGIFFFLNFFLNFSLFYFLSLICHRKSKLYSHTYQPQIRAQAQKFSFRTTYEAAMEKMKTQQFTLEN